MPALLDYAAQTERAHGLEMQAPMWLARPTGWLHGEALALVERLFGASNHGLIAHVWERRQVVLDLLAPIDAQLSDAPAGAIDAARNVAGCAAAISDRRKLAWTEARLALTDKPAGCYPDDTWCRITLESRSPFHRVDAWINDRFDLAWHCWLPIRFWPDAADAVCGPREADVFVPDGLYRHWRRRSYWKLQQPTHEGAKE